MSTQPPNPSPQAQPSAPAPRSTQSLLAYLHNVRGDTLDDLARLIHDEPDPRERAKLHIAILHEVTRAEAVIIRRERQQQQHELAQRYLALAESRESRAGHAPSSQISNFKSAIPPSPAPTPTPPTPPSPRPLSAGEKDHLLAYFPDIAPESLDDPRAAHTWRAALEAQIASLLRRPKLPLPEGGGRGVGSQSESPIPSPAPSPPPCHRHPADVRSDRLNADRIDDSRPTTADTPPIPSEPQASACAPTPTPSADPAHAPSPPEISNLESEIPPPAPDLPNRSIHTTHLLERAGTALSASDLAPITGLRAALPAAFAELARAP